VRIKGLLSSFSSRFLASESLGPIPLEDAQATQLIDICTDSRLISRRDEWFLVGFPTPDQLETLHKTPQPQEGDETI
jgi:hypothetical protein